MAGRYTKFHSNYILSEKHKETNRGTIWQRDWVTIGARQKLEKGKRPYFFDGNFLFTDNSVVSTQKRHNFATTEGVFYYNDVKNAKSTVNEVSVNKKSKDMRDFVYYGSSVELVKNCVYDIISNFPANITTSTNRFYAEKSFYALTPSEEGSILITTDDYELLTDEEKEGYVFFNDKYYVQKVLQDGDNTIKCVVTYSEYLSMTSITQAFYEPLNYFYFIKTKGYETEEGKHPVIAYIDYINEDEERWSFYTQSESYGYILDNPFNIDLYHDEIKLERGINPLRFITYSASDYCVRFLEDDTWGIKHPVMSYTVSNWLGDTDCPKNDKNKMVVSAAIGYLDYYLYLADDNYITKDEAYGLTEEEEVDFDNLLDINDEYFIYKVKDGVKNVLPVSDGYPDEDEDYVLLNSSWYIREALTTSLSDYLKLKTEEDRVGYVSHESVDRVFIYGMSDGDGNITFVADEAKRVMIEPNDGVIESFFNSLSGFERVMLDRDSNPKYTCTLTTPFETENGYVFHDRTYTWPSFGYCLDISSGGYYDYISKLTSIAEFMDENWTDCLWRCMTHESIKNFDWTYTKDYYEGEEEIFIDGGNRMEKLLRIYGLVFDDMKRYVDGISMVNTVTYDEYNNMPDAELSDKTEYLGWNVFSTKGSFVNEEDGTPISIDDVTVDDDFLETEVNKAVGSTHGKWFNTKDNNMLTPEKADIDFDRVLSLSSNYISRAKGTLKSIDMVMGLFGLGDNDYTVTERYFYTYIDEITDIDEKRQYIGDMNFWPEMSYGYSDPYEGIPLNDIELNGKRYLVPYYDNRKSYESDLYFQDAGGWGYSGSIGDYVNETSTFKETLSYFRVVGSVGELLSVNPYSVNNGDIFYSAVISDYSIYDESSYTEEGELNLSHYFYVKDKYNIYSISGWENIDMTDDDSDMTKRARYLDSIIPTQIGNNPHVGYGKYDLGSNYLSYMEKPFKYSLENKELSAEVSEAQNNLSFVLEEVRTSDRKGKIRNVANNKFFDIDGVYGAMYDSIFRLMIEPDEDSDTPGAYKDTVSNDYEIQAAVLKAERVNDNTEAKYYLNDKIIMITNNLSNNELYKKYFRDVIVKYLMQVIPSTAILVLNNFD